MRESGRSGGKGAEALSRGGTGPTCSGLPQRQAHVPEPVSGTLLGKRVFADVLRLSSMALNPTKSVLIRDPQRRGPGRGEGRMERVAEVTGRPHELRKTGATRSRKRQGSGMEGGGENSQNTCTQPMATGSSVVRARGGEGGVWVEGPKGRKVGDIVIMSTINRKYN